MKNGKPYKYSSKDRLSKKKDNKKKDISLDNTIKIDDNRLNDTKLLDTSFLETRLDTKSIKKENERQIINNNRLLSRIHFLRNLFLSLALVCVFVLAFIFSFNYFKKTITSVLETRLNSKEVEEVVEDTLIDKNYLFVGDYFTDEFIFEKFDLDYHYVKSGTRSLNIDYLLNNTKALVYDYNPSKLFIEVGLFDLSNSKDGTDIITNIEKLVNQIRYNRPYAKIYIESVYPINDSIEGYELKPFSDNVTNNKIIEFNRLLKDYCNANNIKYLDMFSYLEKGSKLDSNYTDNGYSLNNKGYKQVYKVIKGEIQN